MIDVKETYKEGYKDNMKKKLYGLLREREKDGEWEKFLDSILIELMGYDDNKKTIELFIIASPPQKKTPQHRLSKLYRLTG